MLDAPLGTHVRLNGRGLAHQHKLTKHGGNGIAYTSAAPLTADEAAGTFVWLGTDGGRHAIVRSCASGREGMLGRDLLRRADGRG